MHVKLIKLCAAAGLYQQEATDALPCKTYAHPGGRTCCVFCRANFCPPGSCPAPAAAAAVAELCWAPARTPQQLTVCELPTWEQHGALPPSMYHTIVVT